LFKFTLKHLWRNKGDSGEGEGNTNSDAFIRYSRDPPKWIKNYVMSNDTIFTMNEQTSGFVEPCV